jgi:hypothetical protein
LCAQYPDSQQERHEHTGQREEQQPAARLFTLRLAARCEVIGYRIR